MDNGDRAARTIKQFFDAEEAMGTLVSFDGHLYEAGRGLVPIESRCGTSFEPRTRRIYVRVGKQFLIEKDYRENSASLGMPLDVQMLFLPLEKCTFNSCAIFPYSLLTMQALTHLDLAGKEVLNLGAAEGLQSFPVMQRGGSVYNIEKDPAQAGLFSMIAEDNGLHTNGSVMINQDILDTASLLKKVPCSAIDVVIANIGNHYPGDVDLAAIHLLRHLPRARYFVVGGYVIPHVCQELAPYSVDRAIPALQQYGFRQTITAQEYCGLVDTRVTFIAERS